MYKKYILRSGKKVGPYYYESLRLPNKKIKTLYLGRNYKKARKKLANLKQKNLQDECSATTPLTYHYHHTTAALLIALGLLLILLPQHPTLQPNGAPITGSFITQKNLNEHTTFFTSNTFTESTQLSLHIDSITTLNSLMMSGAYEGDGTLKIFLEDFATRETYIVYDNEQQATQPQGLLNTLFGQTNTTNNLLTGNVISELPSPTGFTVYDNQGNTLEHTITRGEETSLRFTGMIIQDLIFKDLQGNMIGYKEKKALGLLEPENVTFLRVYSFNLTAINYTTAAFSALSNATYLYLCNYWDFDLDICLSSWEKILDFEFFQHYTYTIPTSTSAFAEAVNSWIVPQPTIDYIVEETQRPRTSFFNTTTQEDTPPPKNLTTFTNACITTCNLNDLTSQDYTLKLFITNLNVTLNNITITSTGQANTTPTLIVQHNTTLLTTTTPPTTVTLTLPTETNTTLLIPSTPQPAGQELSIQDTFDARIPEGFQVEIGKPVKWVKNVKLNQTTQNLIIEVPETAENITVIKKEGALEEDITHQVIIQDNGVPLPLQEQPAQAQDTTFLDTITNLFTGGNLLTGNVISEPTTPTTTPSTEQTPPPANPLEVFIPEPVQEVDVEFFTEAPQLNETEPTSYSKDILVSSTVHYENILTYTQLPSAVFMKSSFYTEPEGEEERPQEEERMEIFPGNVNLYWNRNGFKQTTTFELIDADQDGYTDLIQWITPSLSNQTYEVEIVIINPESYPYVGGNWTVSFNTTGTADLTIQPINGTTWSNTPGTDVDLTFLTLQCGNAIIPYDWVNESVHAQNYSCNETSVEISNVLTPGVHLLQFTFGNSIGYARNNAVVLIDADAEPSATLPGAAQHLVHLNNGLMMAFWEDDADDFMCEQSFNGGTTWNNRLTAAEAMSHVAVATNGTHALWMAYYTTPNDILYKGPAHNCSNFSTTGTLETAVTGLIDNDFPFIDFDNFNDRWIVSSTLDEGNTCRQIEYASHANTLTTASTLWTNTLISGTCHSAKAPIAVTGDGNVFIVANNVTAGNLVVYNSSDNFATNEIYVINNSINTSGGLDISILGNKSLVVTNTASNRLDIWYSVDGGETWSQGPPLTSQTFVEDTSNCVDVNGNFHVVASGNNNIVYMNHTNATGWGAITTISDLTNNLFYPSVRCQNYPESSRLGNNNITGVFSQQTTTNVYFFEEDINVTQDPNFQPSAIVNAPANNTRYTDVGDIIINVTLHDVNTLDTVQAEVFRVYTGVIDTSSIIHRSPFIHPFKSTSYNWTGTILNKSMYDNTIVSLFHLDNNTFINEVQELAVDVSGRQNGTVQADVVFTLTEGRFAGGILPTPSQSTANHAITLGDYDDSGPHGNKTYLVWLKPNEVVANSRGIFSKTNINGDFEVKRTANNLVFKISNADTNVTNFFANADEWVHLGITLNHSGGNTNISVYRNGLINASFVTSTLSANNNNFFINRACITAGLNCDFNGTIDEFVIVNKTLLATEVLDAYRLPGGTYTWIVNATDNNKASNLSDIQTFRLDKAPTVTGATMYFTGANTTDQLACNYTISDDTNTSIAVNISFFNGTTLYSLTNKNNININVEQEEKLTQGVQNKHQNWSCGIESFDGFEFSGQTNATALNISNAPPTIPVLNQPLSGNTTTARRPYFEWNISFDDPDDQDAVNYSLSLHCYAQSGGQCSTGDHKVITSISFASNCTAVGSIFRCSMTLDQDMSYLDDDGFAYNWTVNATDGETYSGAPSDQNLTILGVVEITFQNSSIHFNELATGASNDTSTCTLPGGFPCPFIMINNGNTIVNVNLTGTSLWVSTPSPTANYQYKIRNATEGQTYNATASNMTYANIPLTTFHILSQLNFTDTSDEVAVDINITAPSDEVSGAKSSTLTFTGWYPGL